MTKEQREARILEIVRKGYGDVFLRNSLHGDAIEWRRLTAPNAAERDAPVSSQNRAETK